MQRDAGLAQEREKAAQQAGKYWTWLAETKNTIARREVMNAPVVRMTGVKSVEELTTMKRAELQHQLDERQHEYNKWLEGIKKPKNTLPLNRECNTVEQREAIIQESAKKGKEKLNQATVEYNKWLQEMEEKHKERVMSKVRQKLHADQEFERQQNLAQDSLQKKMLEAKRQQQMVQLESQRAVKDMYERVQNKPLLVEQAYRCASHVKRM